jgi:hypothetical protein
VRRVSYQSMLGGPAGGDGGAGVYVRLGDGAIATRRKDARKDLTVALSKPQARWLREATALSGSGIDEGAILRALVDLGMELELDWAVLASGKSLRQAVRESVMVRRRAAR